MNNFMEFTRNEIFCFWFAVTLLLKYCFCFAILNFTMYGKIDLHCFVVSAEKECFFFFSCSSLFSFGRWLWNITLFFLSFFLWFPFLIDSHSPSPAPVPLRSPQ